MSNSPLRDFTTHKASCSKMGGFAFAGYAARTLPIRSRALRGHYEGTKSRLGHCRGRQVSTDENGKSTGNACVSAESKRVEKAFLHFGKEEVTSSNLVNSSKNLHAVSGSFRGCVLFDFVRKTVVRHLVRQTRRYNPGNLLLYCRVSLACLFVLLPHRCFNCRRY